VLIVLEEFKNCVPEHTVVLNERKITSLQQAATMADELVLMHSGVLAQSDSPHCVGFRKACNGCATHAHSVSLPGPKKKILCFFCLDPGHLVAECVARKKQVAASKRSVEKP